MQAFPGGGQGAGVVIGLPDIHTAEHRVGFCRFGHGGSHPVRVADRQAEPWTPAPAAALWTVIGSTGPYQRSLAPTAGGDNTPQIMTSQGQKVIPPAVGLPTPDHPGEIKKITGLRGRPKAAETY
ncbi:hypothetical protein GCM10017581_068490 [Dactylosporangium matsuzakiense]|uniref:Uncharacterized protein n=1 Tax=Dactylosporangium matsuzakiense TaxID=53360 RepID=A0A9W6KN64_9ACTN|nr:hypothetical protein GCM10017581_068490 [Dactylosporangium matsuzakiense]